MQRPVCALLLAIITGGVGVAACGTLEDEGPLCLEEDASCVPGRPLTVEYLTLQIFEPSCGQTQCHSTFHQAGNLAFDNPLAVRRSLLTPNSGPLLKFTGEQFDPLDTASSNLIRWLSPLNTVNEAVGRMPFDAPLPAIDMQLLQVWMREAPEDASGNALEFGASARGAQCDPDLYDGLACNADELVRCNDDFNFGEPVESCAKGCRILEPCIEEVPAPTPTDPNATKCVKFRPYIAECTP
jgi:hypothetical protein